ncbi:MAG: hypothetical protein MI784_00735 [Cytophagales bacterium]|nr:hypothetical protein [Cytophagales bacterium]
MNKFLTTVCWIMLVCCSWGQAQKKGKKPSVSRQVQKIFSDSFPNARHPVWYQFSDHGLGLGSMHQEWGQWENDIWEDGQSSPEVVYPDFFEVHFKLGERLFEAFYSSRGQLILLRSFFAYGDLPQKVRNTFNASSYGNYKLARHGVQEVIKPRLFNLYRIEVKRKLFGKKVFYLDSAGFFVRPTEYYKKSLPPQRR